MMKVMVAGLAVALVGSQAREAEACSCDERVYPWPADGAVNVPTNLAAVRFFGRNPPGATLTGLDGVEVSGRWEVLDNSWVMMLDEALLPSATYIITTNSFAGVATTQFSTSAEPDAQAPLAPALGALAAETSDASANTHSCAANGWHSAFRLGIEAFDPETVFEVTVTAPTGLTRLWRRAAGTIGASNGACGDGPVFDFDVELCVEVRAHDGAGNRSEPVTSCTQVTTCGGRGDECDLVPSPFPTDAGGCSTGGGAGLGMLFGVWAATRRRRQRASMPH